MDEVKLLQEIERILKPVYKKDFKKFQGWLEKDFAILLEDLTEEYEIKSKRKVKEITIKNNKVIITYK